MGVRVFNVHIAYGARLQSIQQPSTSFYLNLNYNWDSLIMLSAILEIP